MRNLPDEEVFRELEGRLQGYEEQPDDIAWDNISAQIPYRDETWIRWADRSALSVTLILFALTYFNRPVSSDTLTTTSVADAIKIEAPTQLTVDVRPLAFELSPESPPAPQVSPKDLEKHRVGAGQYTTPGKIQNDHISTRKPEMPGGSPTSEPIQTILSNPALSTKAKNVQLPNDNVLPFEPEREIEVAFLEPTAPEGEDVPEYRWTAEPENQALVPSSSQSVVAMRNHITGSSGPKATNTIVKRQTILRHVVPLYFMVTPGLTYYQLSPSTNDAVVINSTNDDGPLDKTHRALEIEAGIQLYLYKGLRFQGGVNYYYQNNHITVTQWGLSGSHGGASGPSSVWIAPNSETTEIEYRMNNVGVSAGLLYAVSLRQFSHQVGVAIQWQYGVGKKESLNYNNAGVHYYNYSVFYRLEFGLSESVRIFGQPGYTGALNSTEAMEGIVTLKYRRIGLGFGIIKDF